MAPFLSKRGCFNVSFGKIEFDCLHNNGRRPQTKSEIPPLLFAGVGILKFHRRDNTIPRRIRTAIPISKRFNYIPWYILSYLIRKLEAFVPERPESGTKLFLDRQKAIVNCRKIPQLPFFIRARPHTYILPYVTIAYDKKIIVFFIILNYYTMENFKLIYLHIICK